MEIDALNTLVSSAIWRAEQLETQGIRSSIHAWAEVSSLEEELAKVIPSSSPEGRIARRGAVRAALKAEDFDRAQFLVGRYSQDEATPTTLRTELSDIIEEHDRVVASRFPYASRYHSLREAQELARRFRRGGPFGLAA